MANEKPRNEDDEPFAILPRRLKLGVHNGCGIKGNDTHVYFHVAYMGRGRKLITTTCGKIMESTGLNYRTVVASLGRLHDADCIVWEEFMAGHEKWYRIMLTSGIYKFKGGA